MRGDQEASDITSSGKRQWWLALGSEAVEQIWDIYV